MHKCSHRCGSGAAGGGGAIAGCVEHLRAARRPVRPLPRCVCCPGPLDHVSGMVLDPPNLTGWVNVPLQRMLEERFGLTCAAGTRCQSRRAASYTLGAEPRNAGFYCGGYGGGGRLSLVINGELYRGMTNPRRERWAISQWICTARPVLRL
ncbi:MAG: ROK family protein [Anaerolineae bacterium]